MISAIRTLICRIMRAALTARIRLKSRCGRLVRGLQPVLPMKRRTASGLAVCALATAAAAAACGGAGSGGGAASGGGAVVDGGLIAVDAAVDGSPLPEPDAPYGSFGDGSAAGCTACSDFPSSPIVVASDAGPAAPSNAGQLFGGPSQGAPAGGPCLVEPEIGVLYPNNWLRPRFAWSAMAGQNLFELRLHVENQANDLIVYTSDDSWTLPQSMWEALRQHSADQPMTLTVRGGVYAAGALSGESLGSSGAIGVAPVAAGGAIVYWGIDETKNTAWLKGFSVGADGVQMVLQPSQTQTVAGQPTGCIGCHAATPDGNYAAFQASGSNWTNGIGSVVKGATGQLPGYLTSDARTTLAGLMGTPAFSPQHWSAGDYIELLSDTGDLHWVNLGASGASVTGTLPRGATDTGYATGPTFSHDGTRIVYATSSVKPTGGRPTAGPIDLFAMHYNGKAGGDAAPLVGAADPAINEYYPAFSPDDALITFTRSEMALTTNTYSDAHAEIWVLPSAGGTPTRLAANDPPACTGAVSPGAMNSWSRWSPSIGHAGGRTFYWIIFSSDRRSGSLFSDGQTKPQLYMTALEIDAGGAVTPHGALYLWNQPDVEHNHLPAWDDFNIPPQGSQ